MAMLACFVVCGKFSSEAEDCMNFANSTESSWASKLAETGRQEIVFLNKKQAQITIYLLPLLMGIFDSM